MNYEEFCINLSKLRMEKKLSAYEVSLRLGKSPSYIHKVETGKINVGLRTVFLLAEILEVPPRHLFVDIEKRRNRRCHRRESPQSD